MTSILYRAPAGVQGDITRPDDTIVESAFIDPAGAPETFGCAVKMVVGKIKAMTTGDTADKFYGVLSRVAPSIGGNLGEGYMDGKPNPAAPQGVVVKGYVNVKCTVGTPLRGAPVYVRVTAATGKAVGDFEANSDGANSVKLENVIWAVAGKDENGLAEIRIG